MGEKTKDERVRQFVNRLRIMEAYHWDYITLLEQPSHIIENITRYMMTQSEYNSKNGEHK
jgi:hypothetical protein